jgi:hypothetical protein
MHYGSLRPDSCLLLGELWKCIVKLKVTNCEGNTEDNLQIADGTYNPHKKV